MPSLRHFRLFIATLLLAMPLQGCLAFADSQPARERLAERLGTGQVVEVIVTFKYRAIEREFQERRKRMLLRRLTRALLEEKAERFAAVKARVFDELPVGEVGLLRDYRHLPVAHMRVRSPWALLWLRRHPAVVGVSPNRRHQTTLAQSLPFIEQPPVETAGEIGAGYTVAVLDTGVDYQSTGAFGTCTSAGDAGCLVVAEAELSTTPDSADTPSDDGQLDDDGHGTNVAGIVVGVGPGVGIAALDVFHTDGYAYSDDILAGINWSIDNRDTYNIVAINMSLGGSTKYTSACDSDGYWQNEYLSAASSAKAAGIATVAASGNDGYTDGMGSPACVSEIVSVGAVYDDTYASDADKVASFSNSASFLDLLAPGVWISAAGLSMSGTSQATPHIAGAVAVMAGAYPYETPDQLISRLKSFGVSVTDSRNGITKPRLDLSASYGAGFQTLICSGADESLAKLTIPDGSTADCTTTNSITAGTAVTVESGGSLTLQSTTVTLSPGFHAEDGSLFYVNP